MTIDILGSDEVPYRWFIKYVGRWSPQERMLRLARIVWSRGEGPGTGKGYCAKLSLALRPRLLQLHFEQDGWALTLCGVRVHYMRSYGGWMV